MDRDTMEPTDGVERKRIPFAFCCAEGGGSISGCGCANPNHGFAYVYQPAALSQPTDAREE